MKRNKPNHMHITKRLHITENGEKLSVYKKSPFSNDMFLKDGTPISPKKTVHFKDTYKDENGKYKIKHVAIDKRNSANNALLVNNNDEWSDYAFTEGDF